MSVEKLYNQERKVITELSASGVNITEFVQQNGMRTLEIKIDGEKKIVPVLNFREDSHKKDIARALISGEPVAAFGIGNYGLAVGVDHPRRGRFSDSWEYYWRFKPDRPRDAHIPILLPPKNWDLIVDLRKIHPQFRRMFYRENLEKMYKEAVISHIIAPTFNFAPHINHPAFVTSKESKNSVSAFWWDDPDLEEIADIAMRLDPNVLIGISSFNDHGENPAFNYEEVKEYVIKKKKVPFKYIVMDPVGESVEVKSSHPQFKVPEKGEKPVWKVVRRGSVSVKRFLRATHMPFNAEGEDEAPFAPRAYPEDINLDSLVDRVHGLTLENYRRRKAA